jgi:hypothetical protein
MKRTLAVQPFRKMRLVPIDETVSEQDRHILEERVRNYDPVVSAMADLLPSIEKPKARRRSPTEAVAIHNANLHRFKLLQRKREQAQLAVPAASADAVERQPPFPSFPDVQVPHMYKLKLSRLLQHVETHPNAIGRTNADELITDGTVHRGTSFSGAIRALYVNSSTPAPGLRQLVLRLRTLGVPIELISSKAARAIYGQNGSGIMWPGKPGRVLRVYK